MNALLQVMFMTPELRSGLFAVDPNELGYTAEPIPAPEKSSVSSESLVNMTIVGDLVAMGFDENGSKKAVIATKSAGMEPALNYYLEHCEDKGFTEPEKAEAAAADDKTSKKKKKPRTIPLELQRLFSQLELLDIEAQSTIELTSRGFQWQGMDGRVQHDAHELNRYVNYCLLFVLALSRILGYFWMLWKNR